MENTARWWESFEDKKVKCNLCPRSCILKEEEHGFCFIRKNINGQLITYSYGKTTGIAIDPIEKKPLNHFYPGSDVLSFGTIGCNLGCTFCQNWQTSKSTNLNMLSQEASPNDLVRTSIKNKCKSIAFTYNEPIIFSEYAIDTTKICKEYDIKTVAVTAGYISDIAMNDFFSLMDGANVDLKAFNKEFYSKYCKANLDDILKTLKFIKKETNCWLEITNLIIPNKNDDIDDLKKMCDWIYDNLGSDVPIHFSAYHPTYKMQDSKRTPLNILQNAYDIAKKSGVNHVYTGNVIDERGDTTFCPNCNKAIIKRNWFQISEINLEDNKCKYCNTLISGRFVFSSKE